jgi:pimeloyl-ACP methyl ester carboxylesterase
MWRPIAHQLDRLAIRSACGAVRPSPDGKHYAEEAGELLNSPGFFAPEVTVPDLRFITPDRFQFESPFPHGPAENNIVQGRITKTSGEWRSKPSVILLHGWNAELQYRWMIPFWSELLANAGVNAVSFELPFHSSRRPREAGAIRNFLSGNLLHFMRATHQTLADMRALARWLEANGSPAVGIWGTSLGAWLGGLAMCHQPEFSSLGMLTPVVRMDRALRELAFCDLIRDQVSEFQSSGALLNLVSHPLLCPPEKVLMIAPVYDLFAPMETITELQQAWGAEIWRCNHGHISILLSTRMMRRIARWLAASLLSETIPTDRR